MKINIKNPLIKGKIDTEKSTKTKISYKPMENALPFNDFHIEREDELTEMVWALQEAGRVFGLQEEERMKKK